MKTFKKLAVILVAGAGLMYAGSIASCDNKPKPLGSTDSSKTDLVPIKTSLSDTLPYDVTIPATDTVLETQIRRDFDLFSWKSFIAINWPADKSQTIGQAGDNGTVWETWKENYDVFLPDGGKPSPWDPFKQAKEKTLVQVGKTPTVLTAVTQPFLTGPLIDQNGQYTRFEIVMNKEMFDYIDTNTLYNYQGQLKFTNTIEFPAGSVPAKTYGAIMVKASWKILGKGDDTSRFHKSKAIIHVPAIPAHGIRDTTYEALVGLVGLHIGTKSIRNPQWIWSTFEQVDNAPTYGEAAKNPHYNFYNSAAGDARMNDAPDHPWDPNKPGQLPSQIVRLTPIFAGTKTLNDHYREQLIAINPKSVWQYYELVGTQWPVHATQSPTGDPFPVYMANATLESYIQGIIENKKVKYVPGVTSSCIGCHNGATTLAGQTSDFTYLLRTASPVKKKK